MEVPIVACPIFCEICEMFLSNNKTLQKKTRHRAKTCNDVPCLFQETLTEPRESVLLVVRHNVAVGVGVAGVHHDGDDSRGGVKGAESKLIALSLE